MKTEFDYGFENAVFMNENSYLDLDAVPVDIDAMAASTVSIPEGDYAEMKRNGIENPDPREYWKGFNSFFES